MNDPERLLWRHLEDRHTLEVLLLHQLLLITLVTPRVSVSRVIGSLVGIKTKASSQPISTKKTDLCPACLGSVVVRRVGAEQEDQNLK